MFECNSDSVTCKQGYAKPRSEAQTKSSKSSFHTTEPNLTKLYWNWPGNVYTIVAGMTLERTK